MLYIHPTAYRYAGDASPSAPGGITVIYKDLITDEHRTRQVTGDVSAALARGRNCLVLTNWTARRRAPGEAGEFGGRTGRPSTALLIASNPFGVSAVRSLHEADPPS